jgi:HD-GYP domain-containing protein (c-di-GMP phosphodiesterase class II)
MPQIYSLENVDNLGENILNKITELMDCPNGYLMLNLPVDGVPENFIYKKGEGVKQFEGLSLQELIGKYSGAEQNELIMQAKLFDESNADIGFLALVSDQVPSIYQNQLFQLFVRQSSSALSNTQLMSKINKSYYDMIQLIRQMVDAKDLYTRGHSDRVSYFSHMLAKAIGKDEAFCNRIKMAGLFHDVGKVAVPDEILMSDRKLTLEEFEIIKQHPQKSSSILSVVSHFNDIANIIMQHHERIDGRGYPYGLTGDNICVEAKIVAISDAFDAMISTRRYRHSLTIDDAINQLEINKGTQFDSELATVFIELVKDWDKLSKELELCEIL